MVLDRESFGFDPHTIIKQHHSPLEGNLAAFSGSHEMRLNAAIIPPPPRSTIGKPYHVSRDPWS